MALTEKQIQEIQVAGESFLQLRRPPEAIRSKLDLIYRIEGQNVLVYEVRPQWDDPAKITETPIAKTTFVQTQNVWKIYWMQADLKWHRYSPKHQVKSIKTFFEVVADDAFSCFFG
ncbi:DUF3024 domain-containing protein [Haliscomenobacter hydrossis]|uniref:DUF3024 domain-containing protein n=1 Tax=Haliscomenobacter hydrossis (strain ATCC 27775 / DSM 1100 / LMG 10767 / O) TaxID=760192 RepID=F4L637_HALH1|nr:DUF3024 domain-containing protein [Haliscomenobacter hydrossis]AEE53097.1 hypothetical protein Halhy_5272 [Haliscomenobacter hydrossis DSM 1100]